VNASVPQAAPGPPGPRFSEARRKAIHLACFILPLGILYEWLPWPRGRHEWVLFLLALTVAAIAIDLARIHDHRAQRFFRRFFGELIREHESFNLLGSTYLLIAALLAVEIFPKPVAAAALGWGRARSFAGSWAGRGGGTGSSRRRSRAARPGSRRAWRGARSWPRPVS
jgi:hypothetical protein